MSGPGSAPLSWISPRATVKPSPIHGRGLFASQRIAAGELVAVKGGYVLDRAALEAIEPELGPDAEVPVAEGLFIGPVRPSDRDGSMIFSNHSCAPNIGVKGQIVFVAMRAIEPWEELTHDWAMTDDDTYEMTCRCGAPECRGQVTGQDSRRPELQARYRGYISWYLEDRIRRAAVAAGDGRA